MHRPVDLHEVVRALHHREHAEGLAADTQPALEAPGALHVDVDGRDVGPLDLDVVAGGAGAGHVQPVGLADRADVPVSGLSGGQRQLLAIASVLATDPGLVVADEPTTLLDLRNARRIGDLLLGLDVPLVLVTHDLELAARCDEAVLFEDGTVRAVGEPAAVIDEYRRSCA